MNEKGLKLDNTSLTHSVERIIMLIIILFVYVVMLSCNYKQKKPPDFSGGFFYL